MISKDKKMKKDMKFMEDNDIISPDYSKQLLEINSDSGIILSDVHSPCYDSDMMQFAMQIAAKFKVENVFLNGDFMDCGIWSNHGGFDPQDWDNEIHQTEQLLNLYRKLFKKCYWILGNHELRYMRETGYRVKFKHLVRQVGIKENDPWCTISENSYMRLQTSTGLDIMLTHPYGNYSNKPLATAEGISIVEPYSIIVGHEHHQAITTSPDGTRVIANVGTMIDHRKVAYKTRKHTRHRKWAVGFFLIHRGIIYPFHKENFLTDREFWLNNVKP